jgi:hypothetical protein
MAVTNKVQLQQEDGQLLRCVYLESGRFELGKPEDKAKCWWGTPEEAYKVQRSIGLSSCPFSMVPKI